MKNNKFLLIVVIVILLYMTTKKLYSSVKDVRLSPHFKRSEFDCNDGTLVPDEYLNNVQQVAFNLEILRSHLSNRPIIITSGYRTKSWNKKVGGVEKSYHLRGLAADIKVKNFSPLQVHTALLQLMAQGKIKKGGVGLYDNFVHYDLRGEIVQWGKSNRKDV